VSVSDVATIKPITAKKTYDLLGLMIEDTTKDWYTYGENKEENLRQKKIFSYGMLFL
jgi:hypothetical protein